MTSEPVPHTQLANHMLALDQVYDVQGWGSPGLISSSCFDNLYINSGRLTDAWYARRKEQGCQLAFYQLSNERQPSLGCFMPDGTLVETLHASCEIRNLHDDAIFYVGDRSWGTVVLAKKQLAKKQLEEKHGFRSRGNLKCMDCISCPSTQLLDGWLRKHGSHDYWQMVRNFVKARAIFFYWMDRTQHLMAEGGARRQADLQAFEGELYQLFNEEAMQ
eukprot:CAMPEP_0174714482 /NCGR_PEP_ID=MMETSP1094-20130205/18097_1 /TAXON_ID=156173 /ORGANISM="Chrysochromulina brevifilum, Strain UTEX LB 985" /LENGTH=217 /DNA_ID=CAMNT_0015913849 /DNA_START=59 /DNA_END=712 /DNA_ORIENTATION=-